MYTMVLVMAMSGSADTPSFHWRTGCGGCGGGVGCVGYGGCVGCRGVSVGCGGCWGSCGGWGAKRIGIFGGLFAKGGCCGGCLGYQPIATCHGCGGGCVGLYSHAPVYYGFAGCYGSCFGSHTNYFSYWSTPPQVRYAPMPPAGGPALAPPPVKEPPPVKPKKAYFAPAPAKVVIALPADAILYANGHKTQQTAALRRFTTPELIPGERYHYVFTVEAVIDGKTVKEERGVEVFAGGEIRVDFTAAFASKKAGADLTISQK